MKKPAQGPSPKAEAKDQVDEVVHKILKALRAGRPVKLAGVGKLVPKPR